MGCLFSPVPLTGQGLFQMYSFLGNKGPFRCHSSWHLNERLRRILPRRRFPPAFPHNTNKEFRAWLTEAVCATSVTLEGSEKVLIRINSRPKGARRHPRSPLCSASPWAFKFCDLEEEAWAIFPLQLMRPPASAVLNYSPPFEVLSVPTNLVDWNQIDCFDWQGSDLLTEKLGGVWGVERRQFTSETWLKPYSGVILCLLRGHLPLPSCFSLLAAGFEGRVEWNGKTPNSWLSSPTQTQLKFGEILV